jgi:hypothetical protein
MIKQRYAAPAAFTALAAGTIVHRARRHHKAHATASLTPLALLALTIVLVWAAAVLRDLFAAPHAPMAT